jgi:serine/threonine-protein kinase
MSDHVLHLTAALADRYVIDRELGQGGMATVYLARDLRHGRQVAIKVLRPELAAVIGAERFVREIRTIAALQHSHILGLIDSGEIQGTAYYVMPFIEGESLRDRLDRERQLPVPEAIRIASGVAAALDYAHRHGVIHRDIKPENILLTAEGEALVADFGIARVLGAADEAITQTGFSVGTPAYMSPEQAAGERTLDARCDVYALGAVVYEMFAGEPPFTGPTAQAILARRFTETPRSLRAVREMIPAALDAAVSRALARAAADRFGSAGEFASALRAGAAQQSTTATIGPPATTPTRRRAVPAVLLALVLGFAIGLGVLFAWRRDQNEAGGAKGGVVRVAVLPFDNLGDSAEAYFADGVSDAVRGKLTSLPGLVVIARTSSIQYRGSAKSPREIAHDLGVRYLLTGAVRWAKMPDGTSRVQVSPELIEITGGAPESRWAQPFDAALTDVFQVQADVAAKVAEALGVAIRAGDRNALAVRPTRNVAAYDDFLRGEAVYVRSGDFDPASLLRAEAWYQRATTGDSSFALAWAQLSSVRTSLYGWDPSAGRGRESRQAVDRALSLGPELVETHRALAEHLRTVEQNLSAARAAARRAHELNPGDAESLGLLASLEPGDSGLIHRRRARDLDPRSVVAAVRLTGALLYYRQYDEAWQEADRGLAFAPANGLLVRVKMFVRLARGDRAGAQTILQDALLRSGPAAHLPRYWDMAWLFTDEQRHAFLDLPAATWPGMPFRTGSLAFEAFAIGDTARGRSYSDSAIAGINAYLKDEPDRAFNYMGRGLHLALVGRIPEARADRDRAAVMMDRSDLTDFDPILLAWLDVLIGDKAAAVALLDRMLRSPHYTTRAWLRIDERFAPLRGYPAFDRLVAGT